jgi:hypothetical protein
MRSFVLLTLSFLAGCVSSTRQELPTFRWAAALGQGRAASVGKAQVYENRRSPGADLAIPFCILNAEFPYNDRDQQSDWLAETCSRGVIRADSIVFVPMSDSLQSVFSQHIGYGASFGVPIYRPAAMAVCYRNLPFEIGIRFDRATGLVVDVHESAAAAGIQVGDFLQSINGESIAVEKNGASAALWVLLNAKPGDQVEVEWIRPGAARQSGRIELQRPRN